MSTSLHLIYNLDSFDNGTVDLLRNIKSELDKIDSLRHMHLYQESFFIVDYKLAIDFVSMTLV